MEDRGTTEEYGIRWSVVYIGCTAIGIIFIGRNIVSLISRGSPVAWDRVLIFEMIYWLLWGLLTPLIFWYARRHRIDRRNRLRSLLALLLFGLIIAPLHVSLEAGTSLFIAWSILRYPSEEILQRLSGINSIILIESFTGFITYSVIVGVYYTFDYYHKYREREIRASRLEGRLAQAELQNLKMQLHPHFLFNTLHAISVLMLEDVEAANRMLIRLSDLLRATLNNAGVQEISLREELEFIRRYLEIEEARFQDRLTVRMEVQPAVLDARVPNLILQPLVENALRHGIAPRAASGLIEISARREKAVVQLQVRDNGPGLGHDDKEPLVKGVGLTNTEARLEHLYGQAHRFSMRNASDGGLLVTIEIPFRT
jgi:sensor histidine kinase YesM